MLAHNGASGLACTSGRCIPTPRAAPIPARGQQRRQRPTSSSSSSRATDPAGPAMRQAWRLQAAAQETVLLQQPSIEFLGVLDGMQTVQGVLEVPADAELVYSILTDYDSCARVFRNIADTRTIMAPEGKQVVQACRWRFLTFSGTFDVALRVHEQADARLLVFKLLSSSFMTDFEGRWQVEPLELGRGCRVQHVLAVKPLLSIPAAIAPYTSSIFKQQVAHLLQDLEQEISRQAADAN